MNTFFALSTFTHSSFKKNAMKKYNNTSLVAFKLILTLVISLSTITVFAQARWQADVSVTAVTITANTLKKIPRSTDVISKPQEKVVQAVDDNLKCSITIHNENDDDARATMLVVVLPVEVTVVSMPSNAKLDPSVTATQTFAGHIIFNIGQMAVGQNVTVEFMFTKSKYGNKVGAYAIATALILILPIIIKMPRIDLPV
jgi:hypothetical protein